jgi:hypothetical protein
MKVVWKHVSLAFMVPMGIATVILVCQGKDTRFIWTKESLRQRLAEIGYKSVWIGLDQPNVCAQGLYVARQTDPRSWEEVVSRRPRARPEELWCGLVLIQRNLDPAAATYLLPISRNERLVGELHLFGDAEDLDRIAAHLQP